MPSTYPSIPPTTFQVGTEMIAAVSANHNVEANYIGDLALSQSLYDFTQKYLLTPEIRVLPVPQQTTNAQVVVCGFNNARIS